MTKRRSGAKRRIFSFLLCFMLAFSSFQIAMPGEAYAAVELTLQPFFRNLSDSEKATLRGTQLLHSILPRKLFGTGSRSAAGMRRSSGIL